jgi:hypothetical protein
LHYQQRDEYTTGNSAGSTGGSRSSTSAIQQPFLISKNLQSFPLIHVTVVNQVTLSEAGFININVGYSV